MAQVADRDAGGRVEVARHRRVPVAHDGRHLLGDRVGLGRGATADRRHLQSRERIRGVAQAAPAATRDRRESGEPATGEPAKRGLDVSGHPETNTETSGRPTRRSAGGGHRSVAAIAQIERIVEKPDSVYLQFPSISESSSTAICFSRSGINIRSRSYPQTIHRTARRNRPTCC